jgi:hypothetical protein
VKKEERKETQKEKKKEKARVCLLTKGCETFVFSLWRLFRTRGAKFPLHIET